MTEAAMEHLAPFVGEWRLEAFGGAGRSVFEWALDGRFLLQRIEVDHPDAPNSLSIIAPAPGGEGYTQHYFDSRGVVRLYSMTFADGVWTLLRETADFSPLDFRQRYKGRFSSDGRTIAGAWETASGEAWEKDFDLTYTRLG
jgi:hypothetical protein